MKFTYYNEYTIAPTLKCLDFVDPAKYYTVLKNYYYNIFRALQSVQDIFGGDFDFDEIAKYGKDYVDDDDEIDEDSYYDEQVRNHSRVRTS